MPTRFLQNSDLWEEIHHSIRGARHTDAAIAYLGKGGDRILPLRRGDRLVIDMSLATVRQGATDPKAVRALQRRGVQVFTRARLHAKVIVADRVVIASSANGSTRSRKGTLDEGGIQSDDPSAVRRARQFVESMCVEPVRNEYLARCLEVYRPPEFPAALEDAGRRRIAATTSDVWILGSLRYFDPPKAEQPRLEQLERQAGRLLRRRTSEVDQLWFHSKPKFWDRLHEGAWVIACMREERAYEVWCPEQVLRKDSYISARGVNRFVLELEIPSGASSVSWQEFRARVWGREGPKRPRTSPVTDRRRADLILSLWTEDGRFRRSRRGKS